MISIELNNYSEEDVKLINELKAMGVDEETIQKVYNETQKRRQEDKDEANNNVRYEKCINDIVNEDKKVY